ncbi:MAG: hypothetical protein COA58_14680 [Bacteroidetes bacterium]|nr:MAG: hypothetical protein COA58_14680 [Bacteroidota bacterium]
MDDSCSYFGGFYWLIQISKEREWRVLRDVPSPVQHVISRFMQWIYVRIVHFSSTKRIWFKTLRKTQYLKKVLMNEHFLNIGKLTI